jgi:hypothetical protein
LYNQNDKQKNVYTIFKIKNRTTCQTQLITEYSGTDMIVSTISVQKTDCNGQLIGEEKKYKNKPYLQNSNGEGYYRVYIE